tara:strand:+ start:374 stop:691 length:318 start_codon:yes stop_codon:yes gene_type:complete
VDDGLDIESKWQEFVAHNAHIEEGVYDELRETAHLFDATDGIHAKWSPDGLLGMLLVFDPDEAEALLGAFYAGVEGVDEATEVFAVWITSLMGMLRQCMVSWNDS